MFSSGTAARRKATYLLIAVAAAATLIVVLARLLNGGSDITPQPITSTAGPAQMMASGSPALQMAGVTTHDPLEGKKYVPNELVVRYEKNATAAERSAARRSVRGKRKRSLALSGAELITLPKGSNVTAVAAKLSKKPGVKYSEPDGVVHATLTPDDASFEQLWAMNNTGQDSGTADADIDAVEAWNTTTGSSSVVSAVIDTGVDYSHEDLLNNIWTNEDEIGDDGHGGLKQSNGEDEDHNGWIDDWRGVNMVGENGTPGNDPMDDHFHGTHVAGTIAGQGNNGVGVAGVTWNTKIMPIKVLNSGGSGSNAAISDGMAYAAEKGARVANLSLGGSFRSQYMEDVVAAHPETLYVVAAGNAHNDNDNDQQFYSCNLSIDNIVCVAATDRKDALAEFSNFGPNNVDLAAPGVDILSAKASVDVDHEGKYRLLNGTSMATPHAAGAASLLLADKPQATTEQLRDALLDGVDKISSVNGKVSSNGRLNVNHSLARLNAALTRDPAITTVELGGSGDLRFTSGTGLSETLEVGESQSGTISFSDNVATILAGDGCTSVNAHHASCPTTAVKRIVVSTGDGNDSIQVFANLPTKINAGSGDDSVAGGAGNDEIVNGPGSDTYQPGDGVDTISYSSSAAAVSVTLDGVANDGAAGEGDSVSSNFETILGGTAGDTLTAGANGTTIKGNSGDDTITGGAGNDVLFDGLGADVLDGQGGDDALTYTDRDGADSWHGGTGTDFVDGTKASDRDGLRLSLDGVANDGTFQEDNYHPDIENLIGSEGSDTLTGSPGDNLINGADGSDALDGGSGGADELIGGSGNFDSVSYSSRTAGVNISLDSVANDGAPNEHDNIRRDIERIEGGSGDDTIVGDSGGPDEDPLVDILGNHLELMDYIDGGPGNDTMSGGAGDDVVSYISRSPDFPVNVSIDGIANDGAAGEQDNIALDVEGIFGTGGNDVLTGSDGADTLNGGYYGDDTIDGRGGDDTLGGGGPGQHDSFTGGDGVDTVDYWGDFTTFWYTWDSPVSITLDGVDNDGFAGSTDHYASDIERFRGGMNNDTMVGDSGDNYLDGGGGTNTVSGGAGNDTVIGGGKNSTVDGGEGDDRVQAVWFKWDRSYWYGGYGGSGWFFGLGGGDVHGGAGNDTVIGAAAGKENLYGDDGDDILDGGYDADVISGGAGTDTADYSDRGEYLGVSLDGVANDGWICTCGGSGEKDQVLDVENVTTGAGNDILTGDANANKLDAGSGVDDVTAGDGADVLIGGDDGDTLTADAGNDLIKSADDSVDTITCGTGTDSVNEDSSDSVATDCEPEGAPSVPSVSVGLGYPSDQRIDYDSVPGLADNVTVTTTPGTAIFTATGHQLDADDGCTQITANSVGCQFADANELYLNVHLGDQDDVFSVSPSVSISARLFGGDGHDTLIGGSSDDVIDGGTGSDQIEGGPGAHDVVSYLNRSNGLSVSLDGVANDGELGESDNVGSTIEDITGGAGNDTLTGDGGSNILFGMKGDDVFDGGLGADYLLGHDGKDVANYSARINPVTIAPTAFHPGAYFDRSFGNSLWSGEAGENDWVGSDVEVEIGGTGNDTLRCDKTIYDVSNILVGGAGTDQYTDCGLREGTGTDATSDTVSYESHAISVNASTDNVANDGSPGENENIPTGVENLIGGSAGDTLSSTAAGTVDGVGGNDMLAGDEKKQSFIGGSGSDTATYGQRSEALQLSLDGVANDGAAGEQDKIGTDIENLIGGSGADSILGDAYSANSITGGAGNDEIDAVDGFADQIDCGDGTDSAEVDSIDPPTTGCESPHVVSIATASIQGGSVVYTSDPGVANNITVSGHPFRVDLTDTSEVRIIPGTGCTLQSATTVRCSSYTAMPSVKVNTNDLNDTIIGTGSITIPLIIDGGTGNDRMGSKSYSDTFNGGSGNDTVDYSDRTVAITATLNNGTNNGQSGEHDKVASDVENLLGGSGADFFTGDGNANLLDGGAGIDRLTGGAGVDDLRGQAGGDTLDGGTGADLIDGGSEVDLVTYQARPAAVTATVSSSSTTTSNGEADENDSISNAESLTGGSGADNLRSTASGGIVTGGSGADTLSGSSATQTFVGGLGVDLVRYLDRSDALSLTLDGVANDGAPGENDQLSNDVENVTGGSGGDTITGNPDTANVLIGGAGSDTTNTVDGLTDSVYCDSPSDTTQIDDFDLAYGCEALVYQPASQVAIAYYGAVVFRASAGIANTVQISGTASSVTVADTSGAPIGPGTGCVRVSSSAIRCDSSGAWAVFAYTDDLNDVISAEGLSNVGTHIEAGDGDDRMSGGTSNDEFIGGPGEHDEVTYANRGESIVATADSTVTSGQAGEGDTIDAEVEDLTGGYGGDTLTGNASRNILNGGAGADTLYGAEDVDVLNGGTDGDLLDGGSGDDWMIGGEGYNTASYLTRTENVTASAGGSVQTSGNGEAGESDVLDDIQILYGGEGSDTLTNNIPAEEDGGVSFSGGPGNDTISGGPQSDSLIGEDGNDTLNGGNETSGYGGDTLNGGEGNDSLNGGMGVDYLDGGAGGDVVDGGGDLDYVYLTTRTSNQSITLDNTANDGEAGEGDNYKSTIEYFDFGTGDDVFDATGSGNNAHYVTGNEGNDTLTGSGGADTLVGDDGDDLLTGGMGADRTSGGWGFDTVSYADHATGVTVAVDSSATDGSPNEKDYVTNDNEKIIGSPQNDSLRGGSIDNVLEGGNGDDTLLHDTGADVLDGGAGVDTVSYSSRTAHVDLTLNNTADDGATGEGDNILPSVEKLTGGSGGDFFFGDGGDNTFTGNAGTDTMMGEGGTDVFDGGADTDIVTYADQTSPVTASIDDWPNDGILGENDNIKSNVENVQGSQGTSTLTGSNSANELSSGGGVLNAWGQGGDDFIIGGGSADNLTGGTGQDTFDAAGGNDTVQAQDSEIDSGTCGSGTDVLDSDVNDTIADCETTPTPPETTITSGPADNAYSTTATPTFTMTSTPAGASFECAIDGGAYTACTSPYTTPTLSTVGQRTVAIRARNAGAFVDATPATRTFTVDLVDPSLSVAGPIGWVNTATPWLVFSASDNTGLQPTKCAIDGGTPFTCTTNSNLPPQAAGSHNLAVTATDLAGRTTSAAVIFNVDVTPPNAAITAPSGLQTTATPTVAFTSTDANGVTNTCSVDGAAYTACTNGMTLPSQSYGQHYIYLRAQDPAGNATLSMVYFTVDTTPADVSVGGGALTIAPTDAGYSNSTSLSLSGSTYTVHENSRASIKAGTGCTQVDAQNLTCPSTGITSVNADMGDMGDQINLTPSVTVASTLNGGTGNDALGGGNGADSLIGGTGTDQMDGNAGVDTATYVGRTNPVTLSNDGTPNDGEAGENDSIGNTVEGLVGGSGNDTLTSGTIASSEVFDGGPGTDTISYPWANTGVTMNLALATAQTTGGAGTDTVSNIENVTGGIGTDLLTGTAADNVIIGLGGNDTINGAGNGASGDSVDYSAASAAVTANLATGAVSGGAGSDTLSNIENAIGSSFNDTINSAPGANIINGAGGTDTISYSTIGTAVAVNLNTTTAQSTGGGGSDTITNVENITGGTAADNLTGNGVDNVIAGLAGNDTLAGGVGNDTLDDSAATTAVVVNLAANTATGGAGTDTISGFESVTGSTANDTLTPSSGNNVIDGAGGTDTITYATAASATAGVTLSLLPTTAQTTGGSGTETVRNVENLIGSSFNDVLGGSTGSNTINGASGTDTISYADSTANVVFNLTTTTAQNTQGAGTDTVTNMENLTGSAWSDTLTGDTNANVIVGGLGSDQINAGSGNDTVVVRDGVNDATTICGSGTDVFTADLVSVGDPNLAADCETISRAAP